MAWHQFRATDDGVECIGCGIEVDSDAEAGFFLPCPVDRCNCGDGDDSCVFVTDPTGVKCHFCERKGARQ